MLRKRLKSNPVFSWQQTAQLIFSAALFFCLLHLSYTDLRQRRLPNRAVALVAVLGLISAGLAASVAGSMAPVRQALIGALLAAGPAVAVAGFYRAVRGRSGLGAGDIKLLAALGLCFGLRAFWILPLASIVCVLSLPVLALWQRRIRRTVSLRTLPFGPYIAIGAVTLLVTAPIFLELIRPAA